MQAVFFNKKSRNFPSVITAFDVDLTPDLLTETGITSYSTPIPIRAEGDFH